MWSFRLNDIKINALKPQSKIFLTNFIEIGIEHIASEIPNYLTFNRSNLKLKYEIFLHENF